MVFLLPILSGLRGSNEKANDPKLYTRFESFFGSGGRLPRDLSTFGKRTDVDTVDLAFIAGLAVAGTTILVAIGRLLPTDDDDTAFLFTFKASA
jgi:hypothetical protein